MIDNYPKAYKEVLEIIKYLPKEEYERIPKEKIEFFEKNCDKEYNFIFDISKTLLLSVIIQLTPNMVFYRQSFLLFLHFL